VYQFKITLKGIRPPIWRRIQVPENIHFGIFMLLSRMQWAGKMIISMNLGCVILIPEKREFDPEHFDVNEVRFDDPDKRWRTCMA